MKGRICLMSYEELWEGRRDVIKDYFNALREYERMRPIENASAVCVQQYFRAYKVRDDLETQRKAAIMIQKTWRGFLGKRRIKVIRSHQNYEKWMKHYHFYATQIQKIWRGYDSRKTKLDFYERKKYLESLRKQGETTMKELNETRRLREIEAREFANKKRQEEFENLTENLHHLVSTKSIKGVYGDPLPSMTRTAFGTSMDEHLKNASKRYFRREANLYFETR